ncbi:RING-H2 finger protein ATL3-like [Silene latifolia]|uniref:RING-H2 finger protein ATL3-like n=1 Tax=Silene latifolia TaxID=37657 RepID=UPI003D76E2A6
MGDTHISPPSVMDSQVAAVSAKIMVTAMIVLFFIVAFAFFLCLYAKWYWSREDPFIVSWRGRVSRQGTPGGVTVEVRQRRGLDSHKLRSLPIVVYDPKNFKEGLECSVCLSEISQGEKVRVLPICNHGFHLECIDMWFKSHSTCPLCRSSLNSPKNRAIESNNQESQQVVGASHVSSDSDSDSDSDLREVPPQFPTNVLIWGNEAQVSSLGEGSGSSTRQTGELVIEIPRYIFDDSLSSAPSTNRVREDEVKTPVVSRLGSLKRMLSRGKRVAPSSSGDVESV